MELQYPKHWKLLHTHGALPCLHPTHATFHDPSLATEATWSSRRHRKGRRMQVKPHNGHVIRRFPRLWGGNKPGDWTNISWYVAQLFTWGSVVWVINGWYVLFPNNDPNVTLYLVGYSALLGGTLFEIGGLCAFLECINRPSIGPVRFDYQVQNLQEKGPTEFHRAKRGAGHYDTQGNSQAGWYGSRWRWLGARMQDLGFWGNTITFAGATIFWISTITGVPDVLEEETSTYYAVWYVIYWLPQVVGGTCFIVASILFMLETQKRWWQIKPLNLGWQVGLWNFLGGCGFWLCGVFGFFAYPSQKHQHWGTALSTFWGSWAFLIGSYIQLYECLN